MKRLTYTSVICLIFLVGSLTKSTANSRTTPIRGDLSEKDSLSNAYFAQLLIGSSDDVLNKTFIKSFDISENLNNAIEDNLTAKIEFAQIKVAPSTGSCNGGCDNEDYYIEITGAAFGNGWDINSVTICGVEVCQIIMQSTNTVVVYPNSGTPGTGNIVITSESKGITTIENGFTYQVSETKEQAKVPEITTDTKSFRNNSSIK
jgi:hypothetical protein